MRDDYFDYNSNSRKGVGFLGVVAIILIVAIITGLGTYVVLNEQYKEKSSSVSNANTTESDNTSKEKSDDSSNKITDEKYSVNNTTFTKIYNDNCDSVVIIRGYITSNGEKTLYCSGSGFIYNDNGYILTNSHVVKSVESLEVELYDGTVLDAEKVGYDERTEVALVKVNADKTLKAVKIGDSDKLSVGEYALAIGHPLGYTYSLTVGIVSGVQRTVTSNNYSYKMIQIDTPINSGNSGGPLFNLDGEVIGITTLKESSSALSGNTIEGMGFAITINTAVNIAEQFIKDGKVSRAGINATVGNKYDGNNQAIGVYIAEMVEGGAAEKAGLMVNDIITEFNGTEIKKISDLMGAIDLCKVGDQVEVKILRDGVEMNITVTLGEI